MPIHIHQDVEFPDLRMIKLLQALIQKRMTSIVSYAYYVARQLIRSGIHTTVSSSINPLPTGYRITIEFSVTAIDKHLAERFRKQLYRSAYDHDGAYHHFRQIDRKILKSNDVILIEEILDGSKDRNNTSRQSISEADAGSEGDEHGSSRCNAEDNSRVDGKSGGG